MKSPLKFMAFSPLVPLWKHQEEAVNRFGKASCTMGALFWEPGTGKTATMINILRKKWRSDTPMKTLILCPQVVIENWKREFLVHSKVDPRDIICLTGTLFHRLHEYDRSGSRRIMVTNYQSLLMDKLFEKMMNDKYFYLILDESHKIKTYNSKTTKRALELMQKHQTHGKYILTGTPLLKDVGDLYPQIKFLDKGARLGDKFPFFREEYFVDFNQNMPTHVYYPNWKMKPGAEKRVNEKIADITMTARKDECLDLPPLVRQTFYCDLYQQQRRVYDELEKDFVADLANGKVVTDLAITKGLRLQQIVSGYCPNEKGEIQTFEANPRLKVLRELLEGLAHRHKVLVWACFRENFKDIARVLTDMQLAHVIVHGDTPDKSTVCRTFEEDDRIRVFVGHPRAAGIGINLTSASYSVFYSRSFSLEDDLQAEARNYRGGSERHQSITRIDLVAPGTIDEVILAALARKQSLSDAVLSHYEGKIKWEQVQQAKPAKSQPKAS